MLGEIGVQVDFGDFLLGVDREVKFVVEEIWRIGFAHQTEIAGVGACS